MVIGFPLYFLKIKPLVDASEEKKEKLAAEELLKAEKERRRLQAQYSKDNYRTDLNMTTAEKALRLSPEEIKAKIK